MKVYRALPYFETNEIIAENLSLLGINYEASNLRLGFCSPNYEYIGHRNNRNSKNNTFDSYNLAKYFYISLYDAINWASNRYNQLKVKILIVIF